MKYQYTTVNPSVFHIRGVCLHIERRWLASRPANNGTWLIVPPGYSWDGCSPKFRIFGKVFGTPDGPGCPPLLWRASLLHDVLYQYAVLPRRECDRAFLDEMQAAGWRWARAYYWAVRLFAFPWYGR